VPILAIDAWEHAYYLQYENDKQAFFDAIWSVVDCPVSQPGSTTPASTHRARPPGSDHRHPPIGT
jgi:hypothetical protein